MALKSLVIGSRTLWKHPAFTVTAVLTIALGIGASTAIFSVTNAVLLQPLPYKDPARLVIAGMELRKRNVHGLPLSNADFIDLRVGTKAFLSDLAGVFTGRMVVPREDGTPEQIRWATVTTNFFSVTGGKILYGRDFTPQDGVPQPPAPAANVQDGAPSRLPTYAILSYEYFRRRYGGNPAMLGHSMTVPGEPGPIIVGVLAPGFRLYFPPQADVESAPEIWEANRLDYDAVNRKEFRIWPIGRLKKGATLVAAQSAADGVAAQSRKNYSIYQSAGFYLTLEPMRKHLVAAVRPAILALTGSVIFLLLIACANVANLLLVRASTREREFALRAAMGASRWRLIVPLLTEALLLAGGGTIMGLALAWAGIQELRALAPANLPRLDEVRIDAFVLGYTALAGLACAAIFGIIPAWRASRPVLMDVLRGASRSAGLDSGALLRNAVVMAQVALSFVLLIGSGLMFRSFLELQRVDPGFDPHNLLTFRLLGAQLSHHTPEERAVLIRQIEQRLRAIPGVESATASSTFPLTGEFSPIRWGTDAALGDPSRFQATEFQIVLPGYFEAMRTALLEGRTFNDDDNVPGRNRVIIDEVLAKKAYPKQSAIGKRILIRIRTPEAEWVEVIGVVAHQRTTSLAEAGREQVYFTDAFLGSDRVRSWAIRTGSDAASYANQVRAAIKEIDPQLLATEMEPMESVVYRAQAGNRFSLLLTSVFAVIAATLTGIGLYGVLSTSVRQRTSEIGVRMAMGAERGDISRLIVLQGLRLSAFGLGIGLIAALVLGRVISAMLVGVEPTDPATFATMTAVFLAISAFASWLPARRGAALEPTRALREQ
ncbi:MAG TPA: ABC transporter permease [Acidobacteriaceae bacterium]